MRSGRFVGYLENVTRIVFFSLKAKAFLSPRIPFSLMLSFSLFFPLFLLRHWMDASAAVCRGFASPPGLSPYCKSFTSSPQHDPQTGLFSPFASLFWGYAPLEQTHSHSFLGISGTFSKTFRTVPPTSVLIFSLTEPTMHCRHSTKFFQLTEFHPSLRSFRFFKVSDQRSLPINSSGLIQLHSPFGSPCNGTGKFQVPQFVDHLFFLSY